MRGMVLGGPVMGIIQYFGAHIGVPLFGEVWEEMYAYYETTVLRTGNSRDHDLQAGCNIGVCLLSC